MNYVYHKIDEQGKQYLTAVCRKWAGRVMITAGKISEYSVRAVVKRLKATRACIMHFA